MAHTIVVGDTHMDWDSLVNVLQTHRPKRCIVAGDFGWWPNLFQKHRKRPLYLDWLMQSKPDETEIRFIEGNHEDLSDLFATVGHLRLKNGTGPFDALELRPGLWYQPRGSTFTLEDGRTIFFCGGGKSVDAPARTPGKDWFPEEIVRRDELPATLPKADIVISHTVPNGLGVLETLTPIKEVCGWWDDTPDPTCDVLDEVLFTIRPSLWIAAHLHVFRKGRVKETEYVVLNRTDGDPVRSCEEEYIKILL